MGIHEYIQVRILELEGRHPEDAGAWQISTCRLEMGEGLPLPNEPAVARLSFSALESGQPLPPSPNIPSQRKYRTASFYHRINTINDCAFFISKYRTVSVSIRLTAGWAKPEDGFIPMPKSEAEVLDDTHLVPLIGYDLDQRYFEFVNSWGGGWGNKGFGKLSVDYLNNFVFESWLTSPTIPRPIKASQFRKFEKLIYRFSHYGVKRVCMTIGPPHRPFCWVFMIHSDSTLIIEELYVMPEWRGRGFGRNLAEFALDYATKKNLGISLLVPYADTHRENPDNYVKLIRISRRLGLMFYPSPSKLFGYFASSKPFGTVGSATPIEPIWFPERPRAPLGEVMAAALKLGLIVGTQGGDVVDSILEVPPAVTAQKLAEVSNPLPVKIKEKIFSLERPNGWYEEDTPGITHQACLVASKLASRVMEISETVRPPRVSPSQSGGVTLSWRFGPAHFLVQVLSNDLEHVRFIQEGPEDNHNAGNASLDSIVNSIRQLVNG